ncbi:A/G-specific adenine glycosylase [Dermatobacter hominis]|uniref:A/G-specific adenine glycosylase n=1 Tax=Dermatobacter hominis TaxID=2884263 RepID=UPI001D0FC133|nr:A/G-specific adenine glycosylase [Dermatobacter hominis]UDY35445.1 A/G-specific adenine glycosylase [Dermatobacter hominis]
MPDAAGLTSEQADVLSAGLAALRDLPWRRTRDPWAVLVSEVMLQQTQVARVVPRYERFLERWPTPAACAAAPLGDVLTEWQGLGYPRRARHLWSAARACVEHHGGELPHDLGGLLALPGVGAYTARAVLAFALEQPVGVVDTNIARVLARRDGRRLTPTAAQSAADAWVPADRSWEWNQVLMDLGARRCRPVPDCDGCPVTCRWRADGWPAPDPALGSAGVSRRQAPFEGSDRQLRGLVLAAVAEGRAAAAVVERSIAERGVEEDRVAAVVESLVADGLVVRGADGVLAHP